MTSPFPDALQPYVRPRVDLRSYTTFQLGGPCTWLADCPTAEVLQRIVVHLHEEGLPWFLMGGGSNLLISDDGVDAMAVRYVNENADMTTRASQVEVSGAASLDEVVARAVDRGWDGLTTCSGIPGTVGGAIAGNAGAFGKQVGDVLASVEVLSRDGVLRHVSAADLEFSYRASRLQWSDEIVVSARFDLRPGDRRALQAERTELLALRRTKHPDWRREPCMGSIFRNIEPTSAAERRQAAGWFLEQAGAKELRVGGAYVYPRHANIIVRDPTGTAQDVYDLIELMARAVRDRFEFDLVREVRFLGGFRNAPFQPDRGFF